MTTFKVQYGGETVHCSISPCSWMYPDYGLQVQVSLDEKGVNAASEFIRDAAFKVTRENIAEALERAKVIATAWLASHDGVVVLRRKAAEWKRIDAEFAAELAKEDKAERRRIASRKSRAKSKGFTHRFVGWVHPSQGDDYQVEAFTVGEPTASQVAKLLRGSAVKTDYVVEAL